MPAEEKPTPPSEWQAIVENVPLVSVDPVVEYDGGILFGKRKSEPAKGGTVRVQWNGIEEQSPD